MPQTPPPPDELASAAAALAAARRAKAASEAVGPLAIALMGDVKDRTLDLADTLDSYAARLREAVDEAEAAKEASDAADARAAGADRSANEGEQP